MNTICTEFTKTYSKVNLAFKNKHAKGYDYKMILIYQEELNKGYKVKKVNNTTEKGTTVVYGLIKSKEELEDYIKFVQDKVQKFNEKWEENLQLSKEEVK